jgi:uncharacterized membrane protein
MVDELLVEAVGHLISIPKVLNIKVTQLDRAFFFTLSFIHSQREARFIG